MTRAPAPANASAIAPTTDATRPSDTFGTDSSGSIVCLPYDRMREPTAPAYYDRRAAEYDDWYHGGGRYAERDSARFDDRASVVDDSLASLPVPGRSTWPAARGS